jgi:hypothetical protein
MDDALEHGRWSVAASNGVLGAISAADAVASKLIGRHSSSKHHDDAAELIASLPLPSAREKAKLLARILDAKHAASYDDRAFGQEEARILADRVHRFLEWAHERIGD